MGFEKKKKFSIQAGWRLNPTKLLKMVHFTKSLWVHVPFKKNPKQSTEVEINNKKDITVISMHLTISEKSKHHLQ